MALIVFMACVVALAYAFSGLLVLNDKERMYEESY